MNTLSSAIKSGLALVVVVTLFGCMEKTVTESPLPAKPVAHSKTAKPGAPIKLASDPLIVMNVNQPMATDILLDVDEPSGEVVIELSASQGLSLENTSSNQRIKFDAAGTLRVPVILSALENGRYYLNIHTRLNDADSSLARNLAVIVQVGPVANKVIQLQKSSGENIIVLPAKESISAP